MMRLRRVLCVVSLIVTALPLSAVAESSFPPLPTT